MHELLQWITHKYAWVITGNNTGMHEWLQGITHRYAQVITGNNTCMHEWLQGITQAYMTDSIKIKLMVWLQDV